jgi:Flp pilus assembly pilin Flp
MRQVSPAAPRRAPLRRFLRSDDGAVTADYVVLLAMATTLALITVGALLMTSRAMTSGVGMSMSENDSVSDSWAAVMRSYQPIHERRYERMFNDFSSLPVPDLVELAKLANDGEAQGSLAIMAGGGENEEQKITDMTYALGRVFADRLARTPAATGHDEAEVTRILTGLGWEQRSNGRIKFPNR